MNSLLQLTLGIVTAIGGFVDIGELVFSVQAGVRFGYSLLWAIFVGTIGIILFSEQAGRIAAVTKKPIFLLMKERFPHPLPLILLILSTLLNVITCAAEVGGVTIGIQLLTGLSHLSSLILTVGMLITVIWVFPFKILEKIFGILGITMIVFIFAVFARHVDLHQVAAGFIPTLPHYSGASILTYLYFAVGIISSCMMPYEVYFYSSGAVEEKWTTKDLFDNRLTANIGMILGAFLSGSLLILGGDIFKSLQITPQLHGSAAMLSAIPYGKTGLIIALLGIIFTIAGACIETGLAGAYNICQYFGWKWGRHSKPTETPLFFDIEPVSLVEYAVIFSLFLLPFTYFMILRVSTDNKMMGKHVTKTIGKTLGWIYVTLSIILAVAAVPLMILTNMGKM
jgi:manganese transport protein